MVSFAAHIINICLLVLFSLFNKGTCLTCYDCEETEGRAGCTNYIVNQQVICTEPKVCVHHRMPSGQIGGFEYTERVIKACRDKDYCDEGLTVLEYKAGLTMEKRMCKTCITDLCNKNSVAALKVPVITGFMMLILRAFL